MTEKNTGPTHTPLYFGIPENAVCVRHGKMVRKQIRPVTVDDHAYTTREGIALYACPECCIDLFAIAGEPNVDPDRATRLIWEQYVDDDWTTLEALFVTSEAG